jgi:nitroreductase
MNRLANNEIENAVPAEQTKKADLNHRDSKFKRLSEYLDYCCQQRKTVTYLDVAEVIDIQAPHRIHKLTQLLEALMEHDQKRHQPLRAALVVSRSQAGLPAEGFFLKAQALGLMTTVIAEEFHQACLYHLFNVPALSND